jgi:hypothetical protein
MPADIKGKKVESIMLEHENKTSQCDLLVFNATKQFNYQVLLVHNISTYNEHRLFFLSQQFTKMFCSTSG